MKQKTLLILGGVLVASAVTWYLVKKDRDETFSGKAAEIGQILLSDIPYETAAGFTITDEKNSVEITKKDGKWVVANRDNFPANLTTVNDLTDNAFNLKVQRVEKGVGASQYGRLGLAAPGGEAKGDEVGRIISIKGGSGNELGGLVVGKVQEVKSGADFDFSQPQPRPQWIKVNNSDVIYLTATGFSRLEAEPKNWLDKEKFFKVEKLKSVTVAGPTPEESWKIFREKDGDTELKLDAPAAGEEFDSAKAASQGSAFSFPSFDDILPEADKAKAALDKPTHTVTVETFEGLTYTVKVGAKVEPPKQDPPKEGEPPPPAPAESYYVSFNVAGTLNETPPPYATPAPVAPTEPAALAADANDEAKKKHEEDKKKFEEAKKNHETAVKTWEEGKKNAEETFKKDLQTKKEKLAAEQALQTRTFVVQKYVLDVILKKRSEFMKEKPAAPPAGTPSTTPGTATPPVSVTPVTPPPGGKIEATTPPIEVRIPGKEGEANAETPAAPAGDKPKEPAKTEKKPAPKRRNR